MEHKPFRIIFMGTPEFAVPSLQAMLDHGERVVAVVTQPDRPKGRGRKLAPPPVKILAQQHDIPVLQPIKIKTPEFLAELRGYNPDLIVVTAYGRILPGRLLDMPPLGTINVHGSLLPKYRGAAPIQWAVINGEKETGITIMQMDEGMDTGDILLPGSIPIEEDDTAGTLAVKLAELGGKLLVTTLDMLRDGKLRPQKQDETQATMAPLLSKEQGRIDWTKPAAEISCLIRGLDPWPTAYTSLEGRMLRLFSPQVVAACSDNKPGRVVRADRQGLLISTGAGCLLAREIQREGSKRMPVEAFLPGNPVTKGARLG